MITNDNEIRGLEVDLAENFKNIITKLEIHLDSHKKTQQLLVKVLDDYMDYGSAEFKSVVFGNKKFMGDEEYYTDREIFEMYGVEYNVKHFLEFLGFKKSEYNTELRKAIETPYYNDKVIKKLNNIIEFITMIESKIKVVYADVFDNEVEDERSRRRL